MTIFRGANPLDNLSNAVKKLIIAYFMVYLFQISFGTELVEIFALRPAVVIQKFWIWQLFTYSFLHGSFTHLFFNVFALWMFGSHVENAMGTKNFVVLYFSSVFGAALCQLLIAPNDLVVGASGGIYGILAAFGFLFPDAIIYLFFILPLRAIQAVTIISLITLASALGTSGSKFAHFAHLGGLLTGVLYFKFPVWRSNFLIWKSYRQNKKTGGRKAFEPRLYEDDLQTEVDRILDKISSKGIDSLTPGEHKTMKKYAKQKE